ADAQQPLDFLLIAGVPLNEPVVRYGPFVMNTEVEIMQAIADYQNGRIGQIHV
ncbi:MAG TPA: pirin-like C-terminal cupin domain-containing protein, partial [Kamptonema sp.]|nr:pirin-like C-terminal cupin domain-containing protein [Kamptonema sp.]